MFGHARRVYHVAVCLNNCIVVIGGNDANHGAISSYVAWQYNLYTEQRGEHKIANTQDAPTLAIKKSCGAVLGTNIYMFGGFNGESYIQTNDLWKLSKSKEGQFNWTKTVFHWKEKLPSPRDGHRCWEYRDCLWVFGGCGQPLPGHLNDHGEFSNGLNNQLLCFNPCNKTWTNPQCFGTVPAPR